MWQFLPMVIGAVSSLASGKAQSSAVDRAAKASALSAQQQLDYLKSSRDLASKTLGKYSAEGDAARAKMLAFLGLGGDAVKYGVTPATGNVVPETGLGGMTPDPAKKAALPSLSKSLFGGDSPSVYGRYIEGDKNGVTEGQHWLNGGSSAGAQLTSGLTNATAHLFGMKGPSETLGRALGFQKKATGPGDQFGTAEDNASRAAKFDYEGYGNATALKDAFATLSDKDKSFIAQRYGFSGGGDPSKLTLGEFTQWWAERTPEGQSAVSNGDFKSPEEATKAKQAASDSGATNPDGTPRTTPLQTADEAQEAAYDEYKKTVWAKTGDMEAKKAKDEFLAGAGAGGTALAGRTARGMAEVANDAELRNFNGYFGALGGVADTGFNADSGIASSGQTFANSAANVAANTGTAIANAALAKGQVNAGTIDDLSSWIGWGLGTTGAGTKKKTPYSGFTPVSTGLGSSSGGGSATPVSRIR